MKILKFLLFLLGRKSVCIAEQADRTSSHHVRTADHKFIVMRKSILPVITVKANNIKAPFYSCQRRIDSSTNRISQVVNHVCRRGFIRIKNRGRYAVATQFNILPFFRNRIL